MQETECKNALSHLIKNYFPTRDHVLILTNNILLSLSPVQAAMEWDSESVTSEDIFKQPNKPEMRAEPSTPKSNGGIRHHEFVSKTVRKCFKLQGKMKLGK